MTGKVPVCPTAKMAVLHRRAGAEQIAIAVNAVDPRHCGPELMFARPRGRICRLLARIWAIPFICDDLLRSVRRVFQDVVFLIGLSGNDGLDLRVNRNHRVAESIQLGLRFAFGRLDHHRSRDRERNRRRVKAVIH